MKILVRLDDITKDMDLVRFNMVREVLLRNGISPLIGVVPHCQDSTLHYSDDNPAFWQLLLELEDLGWSIAMHGYNHVYSTCDSGLLGINPFSEFAGVPYEEQYDRLALGQKLLGEQGIKTDIFMAPGHSFDKNTLKALKVLGFRFITDGLFPYPYKREGLIFIPCRLLGYRFRNLDTLCIHTNTFEADDVEELEQFIVRHKDSFVSFKDELQTAANRCTGYNPYIFLYEKMALARRHLKNIAAGNDSISKYMSYTYHPNKILKLLRRVFLLPLLLTNHYPHKATGPKSQD